MATPFGDVSQAEIDEVKATMADQNGLERIFRSLIERDLFDVMLTRLQSLKESLPLDNAAKFLAALYDSKPPEKLRGFLETSPEGAIANISYWYLLRREPAERLSIVLNALEITTGLGIPIYAAQTMLQSSKRSDGTKPFLDTESYRKNCVARASERSTKRLRTNGR